MFFFNHIFWEVAMNATHFFSFRPSDIEHLKDKGQNGIISSTVAGASVKEIEQAKAEAKSLLLNGITEEKEDLLRAVALHSLLNTLFPTNNEGVKLTPETFENLLIAGIQNIHNQACAVDRITEKKVLKIHVDARKYIISIVRVALKWLRKHGAEVTFDVSEN